jgi:hypothetical protein
MSFLGRQSNGRGSRVRLLHSEGAGGSPVRLDRGEQRDGPLSSTPKTPRHRVYSVFQWVEISW